MTKCFLKIFTYLILTFQFFSCENLFEFSPYQANVSSNSKNTTKNNLDRINSIEVNDTTFKFAVISDNHADYDDLYDAIKSINNQKGVLFVIHAGDIADLGLLKGYKLFYNIMDNLNIPYLTVIGNHDYRSNGGKIYGEMFGDYNYSFSFKNNKFVLFDNIIWESDKTPDFQWLENELTNTSEYNNVFVISHMPPFVDQFNDVHENRYKNLVAKNNVTLSIHGHYHNYYYKETYNDGVKYLIVPRSKEREYCIITVNKNSIQVDLIGY